MLLTQLQSRILPLHVLTLGNFSNAFNTARFDASTSIYAVVAWPANNRALYFPIHMPAGFTVARFMVANGANLTGTVDIGIYSIEGTRLLSAGNTARSGASSVQYIGVTDTYFPAGHYYLAQVASSTTGTYGCIQFDATIGAAQARTFGALQEALGSAVLPATMTPAAMAGTNMFFFGFTQSNSL